MSFVLPIRPSRSSRAPKTPKAIRTTKTLQPPPPESPRRRPSLASRAGVTKRRSSVSTNFNAPSMSFFEAMFGDDFPDAFAHDGRSCKSKRTFLDLPAELLDIVCHYLSKSDLKRLRLASRELAETLKLRIDRVYASPNRANLDCLNNIVNHPRFSLEVHELIWDDSQLECLPTFEIFRERIDSDEAKARVALEDHLSTFFRNRVEDEAEYESIGVQACIQDDGRLTDIGKAILLNANDDKSRNIIATRATPMSIEDSYILYQKLYQDEREIIKRGWDVAALQRAFKQLPKLRRITITSEAWRPWNSIPVYETPFHRALPAGFRKPSVWPWIEQAYLDAQDPLVLDGSTQHLPAKWRGHSIVTSLLASRPVSSLQEFVLDTGHENLGLPRELFAFPNTDYANTVQVFSTPFLKKLQFSIVEHPSTAGLRGRNITDADCLKSVISAAPGLEDLDLKWNFKPNSDEFFDEALLPLHCPKLRHIALRHAELSSDWIFKVVASLGNLESVILDKTHVLNACVSNEDFLFHRFKQHYASNSSRGPTFTWIDYLSDSFDPNDEPHNSKWWAVVDNELNAFLYDGGVLPFEWPNHSGSPQGSLQGAAVKANFGWLMNGRDPTVHIKRNNESVAAAMLMRNPWPINGLTTPVSAQLRLYWHG